MPQLLFLQRIASNQYQVLEILNQELKVIYKFHDDRGLSAMRLIEESDGNTVIGAAIKACIPLTVGGRSKM